MYLIYSSEISRHRDSETKAGKQGYAVVLTAEFSTSACLILSPSMVVSEAILILRPVIQDRAFS